MIHNVLLKTTTKLYSHLPNHFLLLFDDSIRRCVSNLHTSFDLSVYFYLWPISRSCVPSTFHMHATRTTGHRSGMQSHRWGVEFYSLQLPLFRWLVVTMAPRAVYSLSTMCFSYSMSMAHAPVLTSSSHFACFYRINLL